MPTPKTKAGLSALVGAGCCATLLAYVPQFEGTILRGYKDPIGIVTACTGHTATAVLGRPYTPAECDQLLVADLVTHAEPVLKCVPQLKDKPYPLAASVSFAFNIGNDAFCNSTFARKLKVGDPSACAELDRWVYANGRKLPGLVSRRSVERDMCEGRVS